VEQTQQTYESSESYNNNNKTNRHKGDLMMDVERLKKLNTLAGELKGQGIAGNYEDAAYLATAIHGKEPEACLSGMNMSEAQSTMAQEIMKDHPVQEMPEESELPQEQQVLSKSVQQVIPQDPGLSKMEVENILQAFANQVSKEFSALQQQVQRADAQITELTATVQGLRQQPGQQVLPISEAAQVAASGPTPSEESKNVQPEIKDQYSSDDVSVEKMFYFGNK
jgi:hypothetical protein